MHEARYYKRLPDAKVRCRLCPRDCLIYPERVGACYVRYNDSGSLYALTYGRVSSVQLDPIEKKPLHYFYPGSSILSIGALGCNLECFFCQNWSIAHPKDSTKARPKETIPLMTRPMSVKELVDAATAAKPDGNIGVAFTYNEPLIWMEYVLDAAQALRAAGLKVVLVTNGFVYEEPLRELLPYVDAMNIDVKAFTDPLYKRLGGSLGVVKRTAEIAKRTVHVELTNLLVPDINTSPPEIAALVDWVAGSLGADTPLHFSRCFPARRFDLPPTTIDQLEVARGIAGKRLHNVVLGNI